MGHVLSAGAVPSSVTFADSMPEEAKPAARSFWPDGARMVVSVSMQMEGGAQPASGAESPMPKIDLKYPDLPASMVRLQLRSSMFLSVARSKVTSHMIGAAVDLHSALVKEIVQRGHEATGHGQTWTAQFSMTPERRARLVSAKHREHRASDRYGASRLQRFLAARHSADPGNSSVTWLIYHIDDVSRDEPFLTNVRDKPFAEVPYTLHMNDIVDYETRYFSTAIYADDLKAEFDALYEEAGRRRRMMSVSAHHRIAGRPSRAKVFEQFIIYAQSHPGVAFMRKDEIARFAFGEPPNRA
jgi:peptidoglycan/xylan/chitin deacetylase (PgdA/CDA1 family)